MTEDAMTEINTYTYTTPKELRRLRYLADAAALDDETSVQISVGCLSRLIRDAERTAALITAIMEINVIRHEMKSTALLERLKKPCMVIYD